MYILSNLLSTAKTLQDLENCFQAYDTVRRPRKQKVVRLAGACTEFAVEEIGDNNSKQAIDIDSRYRFVWNEDIEQHLAETKRLLTQEN